MHIPDKLPELRNTKLVIYRIVWCIAFCLALLNFVGTTIQFHRTTFLAQEYAGLGLRFNNDDLWRDVSARENAEGLGIGPSDEVVAIDGQPITNMREALSVARGPDGATVVLELRGRGDGVTRSVSVQRDRDFINQQFGDSGLTFLIFRTVNLGREVILNSAWFIVSILLFVRRPNEMVAALIALGPLLIGFDLPSSIVDVPQRLVSAVSFGGLGLTILGLMFFPKGRIFPRWSIWGLPYVLCIIAVVQTINAIYGELDILRPLFILSLFLGALIVMIFRFRQSDDEEEKNQIKFVVLGIAWAFFALGSGIGISAINTESLVWISPWVWFGLRVMLATGFIAIPVGILIALLRYRLFDANLVVTRSATYAIMTLLLGIGFFAVERAIDFVGNQIVTDGIGSVSFGITAALAAILIGPLHAKLLAWSEHRFQRGLVMLKSELPETARDMRQIASTDELLNTFLQRLSPVIHARHAAIINTDGDEVLAASTVSPRTVLEWVHNTSPLEESTDVKIERTDQLFPLRAPLKYGDANAVAWLVLGPRIDGSFYNRDERETILSLLDPIARAIATVRKREKREAYMNSEVEKLGNRLTTLEAAIYKMQPKT